MELPRILTRKKNLVLYFLKFFLKQMKENFTASQLSHSHGGLCSIFDFLDFEIFSYFLELFFNNALM